MPTEEQILQLLKTSHKIESKQTLTLKEDVKKVYLVDNEPDDLFAIKLAIQEALKNNEKIHFVISGAKEEKFAMQKVLAFADVLATFSQEQQNKILENVSFDVISDKNGGKDTPKTPYGTVEYLFKK